MRLVFPTPSWSGPASVPHQAALIVSLDQQLANSYVCQNHLEGLLHPSLLSTPPKKRSTSVGLGWGQYFSFLSGSQVMLLLL